MLYWILEYSMRPDDPNAHHPSVFVPQRPYAPLNTSRGAGGSTGSSGAQAATADLARKQLDTAYADDPHHQMAVPQDTPADTQPAVQPTSDTPPLNVNTSPYDRSHSDTPVDTTPTPDWQTYHSAWQNYYQQYFQRYYAGHLHQAKAEQQSSQQFADTPQEMTQNEALLDLRSRLRKNISDKATKARKSRHFVPILAAVVVMGVFGFLQYNRVLFANVEAYVSPGAIEPTNVIVDPNTTLAVGPEPKLIIPKLNIDVPVVWDAKPDHDSQMEAMTRGVAWFGIRGANAHPGEVGNTVLSGHSSNDWIDTGEYKFIFVRLEQMNEGDMIYINYNSARYSYKVTKKQVVAPTNVQALQVQTDKPLLTLITCVPIGTADNRLLVTAEQISPDPSGAAAPADSGRSDAKSTMPGNSPTFIERIFGGG